ncbi:MAG: M24 family metallopeptidase, partial [Planctomycetota bacterium]
SLFKELFFHFPVVEIKKTSLYATNRMKKTSREVEYIRKILKITARAFDIVKKFLRDSRIKGKFLYYRGVKLTSEFIRKELNQYFAANDAFSTSIIIACGKQGCEPHNIGTGPVYPHQTIIVDIYPRSLKTRYWGDMTRTFVKGDVSDSIEKLYRTVENAQSMAISRIKNKVNGAQIHNAIVKYFDENGYKTGLINGKLQGFLHGTGHGLGLDIHEPPRIAPVEVTLETGNVVTVEPGLYYYDIGAVRIEDVILVKEDGAELLSSYPKILRVK